jgi:fatty acid/phospholipid biosynthesis enzyme
MGGDNAPAAVINGADIAKAQSPQIEFLLVGDAARIVLY